MAQKGHDLVTRLKALSPSSVGIRHSSPFFCALASSESNVSGKWSAPNSLFLAPLKFRWPISYPVYDAGLPAFKFKFLLLQL